MQTTKVIKDKKILDNLKFKILKNLYNKSPKQGCHIKNPLISNLNSKKKKKTPKIHRNVAYKKSKH